ncbi:MAG: ATP-binding cassette domain-containing protein [Firmicutes bacterium]|nr:ATP-binding cassette domain-containing protein [Bacillota bacterium]
MAVLEARNVSFSYPDGCEALKGVSFKIEKGEFAGLIGQNGSGKTTLLQTFNGLIKPTGGEIIIKGKNIKEWEEDRLFRVVGLVFQNPDDQLFAPTVFEDVSYGLVNMGLSKEDIAKRVEETLKLVEIWEYRKKPVHNLSYGQKKRAAIAGVLAMEPEILILDEPTAGLDPMGVSELMNLIKGIQAAKGMQVIISTHDIDIVPLYCDRIYVMDSGRIVAEGTPAQVFREAKLLRSVRLRLPRVGHLMEILKEKDGFEFEGTAVTISEARKALNKIRTVATGGG